MQVTNVQITNDLVKSKVLLLLLLLILLLGVITYYDKYIVNFCIIYSVYTTNLANLKIIIDIFNKFNDIYFP